MPIEVTKISQEGGLNWGLIFFYVSFKNKRFFMLVQNELIQNEEILWAQNRNLSYSEWKWKQL